MSNKEAVYRQSPLRDDKLVIHTSVVKEHFITHQESFTLFNDTVFHATYPDQIQAKINLASATMSDGFILKTQARYTSKVEQCKGELIRELNSIDFIIKRAFPHDTAVINEFHLNKISEMSKSIDSFIGFSKDVLVMILNYTMELAVEGFTDDKMALFKTKIEELDNHRRMQVEVMHTRPIHTKDRITKMNGLWKQLCELKDVSDIIFTDEPEIKALFALPWTSTKSSGEEVVDGIDLDENEIISQ